jgi:uncharacterized protein YigA (DUF484 family)
MTSEPDAEGVADYLRRHPEFFEQHEELLTQMQVPSPHGGKAVSLAERQVQALREKLRQLESKLAELILFGEENDVIGEKVHRLALDLLLARDLGAVLRQLYAHLDGAFAVPHFALRLWSGPAGAGAEFAPVSEGVQQLVTSLVHPYCAAAAGQEVLAWLGEAAGRVRSLALIPLRREGDAEALGALLLASEEAQRFYAEMGTLYLARVGAMTTAAVERTAG